MNNFLHTKKEKVIDKLSTKLEKKAKKTARKLKVLAVVIGIILAGALCFLAFYNVSKWYDENKVTFQSPILIKLQMPIVIQPRKKAIVVPVKVVKNVITPVVNTNADYERAYDKVWLMESGRGTNKGGLNGYCISKDMINEIGYALHENFCFVDQKEQKKIFMLWLTNRLNHVKMPWCDTIDDCLLAYSSNSYKLSGN